MHISYGLTHQKEVLMDFEIDLNRLRKEGIFLMIPAYGGQNFTSFTRCLTQLTALCILHQIPLECFYIYNESLVQRARNYCVDTFRRKKFKINYQDGVVEERYFQHGMFIDSDIEFEAIDVLTLAHLQSTNEEYGIICGPYPKKRIDWTRIKAAVDMGLADNDPNELEKFVGDYVFNPIGGTKQIHLNEVTEVSESGTGFMMFSRDAIEKVVADNPQRMYTPDHVGTTDFDGSRKICAIFDCEIDPDSNRYLSEDFYFCHLAKKSGIKTWLVPWIKLKHHGYYIFGGSLLDIARVTIK